MKTYRLCELGELKNGLNFEKRNIINPCKIIGVGDFANNVYPNYEKLATIERKLVSNDFFLKEDDIVFVRSNGNKTLVGRTMLIKDIQEEITYSGFCIRFRVNCKDVYPEYLFYALRSPYCRKQYSYSQQTNITNLSQGILGNVIVKLPSLSEQKRIARILSNIDKKIMNNLKINDNLQAQMSLIYEDMIAKANSNHATGKFVAAKELTEVVTGKEDANFSAINGIYKFFTCSNTPLQCDKFAFDSSSILIAGNGDFNVKHYSGKFNAYQRTYVLTPSNKYYAILYFACLYQVNSFKTNSSGSIVKFITKGDVENIQVFIPDDEALLQKLNHLLQFQEQNDCQNEHLTQLRDFLLPILMNGQATIDD